MKSIFLVLLAPIIGTMGQVFLKYGMREIGQITLIELKNNSCSILLSIFSNLWILMAIPLYIGGFILWLIVLSKFNLSFAYPFLALSFVMVPLLSSYIFGEHIPIMMWLGILVVFTGIVIIGISN